MKQLISVPCSTPSNVAGNPQECQSTHPDLFSANIQIS